MKAILSGINQLHRTPRYQVKIHLPQKAKRHASPLLSKKPISLAGPTAAAAIAEGLPAPVALGGRVLLLEHGNNWPRVESEVVPQSAENNISLLPL